jgi:hypothetical protein
MRTRFQILEAEKVLLDTEMQSRSRFTALHELLKSQGLEYDPGQFYQKGDWLCYTGYSGNLYRTSTRMG